MVVVERTPAFQERVDDLLKVVGLRAHPDLIPLLVRFANEQAGWYQSPVYLVGSALTKKEPRDIDIRVPLANEDWIGRYGGLAEWWEREGITGDWTEVRWRWSEDCTRTTKRAWAITMLNVDFQVQPATHFHSFRGRKLRIDTWPGATP